MSSLGPSNHHLDMQLTLAWLFLVSTGVFVAFLVEARLSPRRFDGLLLALALVPAILFSLVGFLRLRQAAIVTAGPAIFDLEALNERLREACAPFYMGFGITIAALLVHALLYVVTRQRPQA